MDHLNRWLAWKEATFGTEYMIWHDGLYVGSVTSLTGAERESALEMLRLGLSLGDSHAAEALAGMGDAATVATMREQLANAQGSAKVRMALAIHAIAREPTLADALIDVLKGHPWWGDRIDAAIGLRHFQGAADEDALLGTVSDDPEYLVRYHASESLLHRWHVEPREISKHAEIFDCLCGPQEGSPTAEDFARYAQARALLEALPRA